MFCRSSAFLFGVGNVFGDSIKAHDRGAVLGLVDNIANHANRFELGILDDQARRMCQEIEHGAALYGPLDTAPDGLDKAR
jgi:hypothetical protein